MILSSLRPLMADFRLPEEDTATRAVVQALNLRSILFVLLLLKCGLHLDDSGTRELISLLTY